MGRFKVGSVAVLISKGMYIHIYIYVCMYVCINLHNQLKICLPTKILKFITPCLLKKDIG